MDQATQESNVDQTKRPFTQTIKEPNNPITHGLT